MIASFDRLARSGYADVEPRALLPDRIRLRQGEWNTAVERLLVETLGDTPVEPPVTSCEAVASA